MWMLIEGLYLYSRFTVFAMRHGEAPYWIYWLAGWGTFLLRFLTPLNPLFLGTPFVVVNSWAIVHQYQSNKNPNSFCWVPYAQGPHLWILAGTMGLALIVRLNSFLLHS